MEEFVNAHNLIPITTGNEPTFTNKNGSSRIDITMATEKIAGGVKNWKVKIDIESFSTHKLIYFEIHKNRNNQKRHTSTAKIMENKSNEQMQNGEIDKVNYPKKIITVMQQCDRAN